MHIGRRQGTGIKKHQRLVFTSVEQKHIEDLKSQLIAAHKQIKVLQSDNIDLGKKYDALAERHAQKLSEWGRKRIVPEYQPSTLRK
jgi:hypothetical protein